MNDASTRSPVRTTRSGRGRLTGVVVVVLDRLDPAAVAADLAGLVRDGDEIEIRGERVVVLADGLLTGRDLRLVASRLLPAVTGPGERDRRGVGLAIGPLADREDLVARAIEAAAASSRSDGAVVVHDAALAVEEANRRRLVDELVAAIPAGRFEAHLQPIVDLADGRLDRVEALARWRHPVRQVVRPAGFVDAAVEAGVLDAITEQVVTEALIRVLAWDRPGRRPLRVVIELHRTQVATAAGIAARSLAGAGAGPGRLILVLPPGGAAGVDLDGLVGLGVGLAVQDPEPGTEAMADTVRISCARLRSTPVVVPGRIVVATGIETPADLERARSVGAALGQGFAIHRPVPAERLEPVVSAGGVRLGS